MSEAYGPAWARVVLMVHKSTGEMHAVGGDQDPPEGDYERPYVGLDRILARLAEAERERDEAVAEVARLRGENTRMRDSIGLCSGSCGTPEEMDARYARWAADPPERSGR